MDACSRVFLEILKAALKGEKYTLREEVTAQQWQQILNMAWEHHLLPMVFEAAHHLPGLADTPLAAMARRQVRQVVAAQAIKTFDFLELNDRLRRGGVTPLVVKGLICRDLYPLPDHRISGDEDLLIPISQFPVCQKIMADFGMETSEQAEDISRLQEIPYRKAGSPLYIELHINLFSPESEAYGDLNRFFEGVFDRAAELRIQGRRVLTMAPTDHLFYLICHGFKHFLHSGFGIRQVCDIAMFAQRYGREVDWAQILENCRAIRAEKFAAALFQIAENHLGFDAEQAAYPESWQNIPVDELPLLEDLLESGIYGGADMDRKHSSHITLTAAADQKKGRKHRSGLLRSLFPAAKSLEGRYPYLKKSPALLPVAWFSRMVSYGKNHGTETAASAANSVHIGNRRLELMRRYGILEE